MPLPEDTVADITADDLAVRIKTLADDTFEGRGPGTPTGEAAADWIAAEMNRIGLEPGADNGSYLQEVKMVNQTIDPSESYLSLHSRRRHGNPDHTERRCRNLDQAPERDRTFLRPERRRFCRLRRGCSGV
jgi:hypothetical protein